MNILFIGCVESSEILLKKLIECDFSICGVITKREAGINADFCDLTDICEKNNIDIFYVKNVNDTDSIDFIRQKSPDIIYCFGWSQLIKSEILSIPKYGCIGFHPAELPMNKGRHPIIWALALGLTETASSFFIMDDGADTGKIISQEKILIDYNDDASALYKKIMDAASIQVIKFTYEFENQKIPCMPINNSTGNNWRKRSEKDGIIDWRMSSRAVYNLVRALTKPYIGAEFIFNNEKFKIWKCEEIVMDNMRNIEPGKVIKVVSANDYYVKTYDNIIHVTDGDPIDLEEGNYL